MAKIITKNTFQQKMAQIIFKQVQKTISLQSKFLRRLSCKQGRTSGRNIAKKMFWWYYFCNNFKDHYKNTCCSKELFCNSFGQDGKHKLFGRVALGTTPGMSRGQTGFVPGTKCRFSPYFTQWKPSLSQGQAQFVPGINPGTKGGRKSLRVKSSCAFLAPLNREQNQKCFKRVQFKKWGVTGRPTGAGVPHDNALCLPTPMSVLLHKGEGCKLQP